MRGWATAWPVHVDKVMETSQVGKVGIFAQWHHRLALDQTLGFPVNGGQCPVTLAGRPLGPEGTGLRLNSVAMAVTNDRVATWTLSRSGRGGQSVPSPVHPVLP